MVHRRVVLLLAVLVMATTATTAGAHTQIRRATPGPGETLEGPVDSVTLEFLGPVLPTPVIGVTGPEGTPVVGLEEASLVADDVARVGFDPLTEAGQYQVDYTWVALDGATQEGAHQFTVAPSDGGAAAIGLPLALAVGALVLVVAAVLGRRRSRT